MKKSVAILATGGTIAGVGKEGVTAQYDAGSFSIQQILQQIPKIQQLSPITYEQLWNVDSNDLTEKNWITLAKRIQALVSEDEICGVVVTHGTDTLEETAYFLNLVIKTEKPIVLTGAMRPVTATSADGPQNLYQAVALASSEAGRNKGVLVVFSDTIYGARDVQKGNNFRTNAFHQMDFSCLGYMRDEKPYFFYESIKKHTMQTCFSLEGITALPCVEIIYFFLGASIKQLQYTAQYAKGIVIAGSGCGCFSKKFIQAIKDLEKKGIPVVRSSRVSNGIVIQNATFDQSENSIPGNSLSPQKARILLALALTKTNQLQQIKEIYEIY